MVFIRTIDPFLEVLLVLFFQEKDRVFNEYLYSSEEYSRISPG